MFRHLPSAKVLSEVFSCCCSPHPTLTCRMRQIKRNMTIRVHQRPCWIGGPRELVRLGLFATVGCSGEEQVLPLPPVVVPPPPPPTASPTTTARLPLSVAETDPENVELTTATSSLSETEDFGVFLRRLIFPSNPLCSPSWKMHIT